MDDARLFAGMRYAHLEEFYDDDSVRMDFEAQMEAAEEYLAGSGVTRQSHNQARYDAVLLRLAAHWYDHRDELEGSVNPIPLGVRPILNQLKYTPGGSTWTAEN